VGLLFALLLLPYWSSSTGLTSLISIGDKAGPVVPALAKAPHHVFKDSWGYDGMQYAQLALHPDLKEPALSESVDNLPYRARRMLLPWVAHLAGLGVPVWILQAYASLNIVCWVLLAFLLLKWFPLTNWDNWLRWAGILLSHGACMSVQMSLTDLPGVTLLVLALFLRERGSVGGPVVTLAAATLCKETSLLAGGLLWKGSGTTKSKLLRSAGLGLLALLPFLLWVCHLRWGLGLRETQASQNFGWPLVGLVERWGRLVVDVLTPGPFLALKIGAVLSLVTLTVQIGFLLLRWRPVDLWWRLGAPFALLGLFVAGPVWEGYPGAATRVLLPMSLAFNALVPRSRRWLPLLLLGNLTVFSSVLQLRNTPIEFAVVRHEGWGLAPVWVSDTRGWHVDEANQRHRWRWTSGEGTLKLENRSATTQRLMLRGRATAASARTLRIESLSGVLCEQRLQPERRPTAFVSSSFELPAGALELRFLSDEGPRQISANDPRPLSFMIEDLEIVVLEEETLAQ